MPTERALITGRLLRGARERARYDVDAAAHVVGVPPEEYEGWERKKGYPTMAQARELATAFQRPLALFYLEAPPDEPDVVAELRRLPGRAGRAISHELAKQIRLASERRDLALSLFEDLGETPPSFTLNATIENDPTTVARAARAMLGVSMESQAATKLDSTPKMWRQALEAVGVLVFQVPGIEASEMQGFAITPRPLPIVAYNSNTTYRRRIFTLFHELGHVVLNDTVLHESEVMLTPSDYRRERFCNRFAAHLLVPTEDLLSHPLVMRMGADALWTDAEVKELRVFFKVSKSVLIRRLREEGRIAESQYYNLVEDFDNYVAPPEPKKQGGSHFRNQIVWLGSMIPELAFRNFYRENLSERDLSSLFNLKSSSLGRMEYEVFNRNVYFD